MHWLSCAIPHVLALAFAVLACGPAAARAQSAGLPPAPGQRVVLITGSTSGLGREVARSIAADGDHLIIHGRRQERGLAMVMEINTDSPGSARFYQADFASLEEVRGLVAAVIRDYGRLDR